MWYYDKETHTENLVVSKGNIIKTISFPAQLKDEDKISIDALKPLTGGDSSIKITCDRKLYEDFKKFNTNLEKQQE